jgi:hypothetical protein
VKLRGLIAFACAAVLFAGCSFQNKYEREAEQITRAVMNNDLRPVQNDIAPDIKITRVQVAEYSDELNAQGKLESVKEAKDCEPGWHCFDVKFEKSNYVEHMRLDDKGKVAGWNFHMATVKAN